MDLTLLKTFPPNSYLLIIQTLQGYSTINQIFYLYFINHYQYSMSKKQMSQDGQNPKGYNYSYTFINQAKDSRNQLRQEVMKATHKKLNGQPLRTQTERDKFIDTQSTNILSRAQQYPQQNSTYSSISSDMINLKQYTQVKMATFQMPVSGSSEDELNPIYQPVDDVIEMAIGVPEILEFYIVAKIQNVQNTRAQVTILAKQSLKGATQPQLTAIQRYGVYTIYKLRVSSLTRKFYIVGQSDQHKLQSKLIPFDSKNQSRLLLNYGFHFNFKKRESYLLGKLEQVLFFACINQTYHQELRIYIDSIKKKPLQQMISYQLIAALCKIQQKKHFYQLVLNLTLEWVIQRDLANEQKMILKLILKTYLTESNFIPFSQVKDNNNRILFIKLLLDILIFSQKMQKLQLSQQQNKNIFKKLMEDIKTKYRDLSAFLVLQIMNTENSQLLLKNYKQQTFVNEYMKPFCRSKQDELAAQISCACYYYRYDELPAIVNGISPNYEQIKQQNSKNLSHSTSQLFNIFERHNELKIKQMKPNQILKFVKMLPLFKKLQNMAPKKLHQSIGQQIKFYVSKQLPKYLSNQNYLQTILKLYRQIYFNKLISQFLFGSQSVDNELQQKIQNLIIILEKSKNNQRYFQILNQLLILEAINKNIQIKKIYKKYVQAIKKKDKKSALKILNSGLDLQFIQKQSNEKQFDHILIPVIEHYFKDHTILSREGDDWCLGFQFFSYINEKILQRILYLKKKNLSTIDVNSFLAELNIMIDKQIRLKGQQKQKLKIIILGQKMSFQPNKVKQWLMRQQKIYLRIFQKIKSSGNQQSQTQLTRSLSLIQNEITRKVLKYSEIANIIPKNSTDISRFKRLFNQTTYQNLIDQKQYVLQKMNKIKQVQKFVKTISSKFQIPKEQINKLNNNIQQSLNALTEKPVHSLKQVNHFPQFHHNILILYKFSFFFEGVQTNLKSVHQVMERCGQQVNLIIGKLKNFVHRLQNKQLSFDQYNYFGIQSLSPEQFTQIMSIYPRQNQFNVRQIISKVKLIVFFKKICQSLNQLIKSHKKFKNQIIQSLEQVIKFGSSIQKRNPGLVLSLQRLDSIFVIMDNVFKKLQLKVNKNSFEEIKHNLPLQKLYGSLFEMKNLQKGPIATLISLIIFTSRKEQLQKLKKVKSNINYIRQVFIQNNDPNVSFSYQDYQNYNTIMNFYFTKIQPNFAESGSVINIIKSIAQISDSINTGEEQIFNVKLLNLIQCANQFQECNQRLKDLSHVQTVNIKKLVQNSQVIIEIDSQNQCHQITIQVKTKQNSYEKKKLFHLSKYKDEAYIIKNKSIDIKDQEQRENIKRKVQVFINMHNYLIQINEILENLLDNGYILFKDQKINLEIKNQNLEPLMNFFDKITQSFKNWDRQLQHIYASFSWKATMIKGIKLKEFYLIISGQKPIKCAQNFRHIATMKQFETFIKENSKNKKMNQKERNAQSCLQLIRKFFSAQKNILQKLEPAKDREQNYVQIIRFTQQKKDFICCINQMKQDKLKRIQQGQIMSCKKDTTKQDLKSWIQRSIVDPDGQYILLGYDNLSPQLQNHIVQKVEQNLIKTGSKIKYCLAGTQTANQLYRYFKNNNHINDVKTIEGNMMKEQTQAFNQYIKSKINDPKGIYGMTRVYSSDHPGLGKTYQITKQISSKKEKALYFPISGRTESRILFAKLSQKIKQIKEQQVSLLIQLYQIDKQSIDIVNDFVRQIILFRSYQYKSEFCVCKKSCKVYIQAQDQNIIPSLPFLNYLNLKFKQIFINITKFQTSKLEITAQNTKLCYILEYLQSYDKGRLDNQDLPHPSQFKPQRVLSLDLVNKYFVLQFPKNKKLTFYQYKYWIDLFYQSCCSFSNYIISHGFFDQNKKRDKKAYEKLKLQKIRSQFFQVLLNNSIQFLSFSIEDLKATHFNQKQNKQTQKQRNLSNIPFLLIPNNQNWFSFIYKQTREIPPAIRSFLVSQYALQHKININKPEEEQQIQKKVFQQLELKNLEKQSRDKFQSGLQKILRQVSGNNKYQIKNDPGYVLNIDNFVKICLISYKMKVNIPLVIQGEAGVGKTALLRHLVQEVFNYQFIPHTINAGITQLALRKKIEEAQKVFEKIQANNQDEKNVLKKKVCIFFDEFNTLPQLGYIKQIMMDHKFHGQQIPFFKNLIVFAACNPYRNKIQVKNQNQTQLAFTVKRPPLSIGEIMWNFGSLSSQQMEKYISKMLSDIDQNLPQYNFVKMICDIQNSLNNMQYGSTSLRDVQRFRQLYVWLRENMPIESNIPLTASVQKIYGNKALRAFFVTLYLVYVSRLNSKTKQQMICNLIKKHQKITIQLVKQLKNFQQEDFASRLRINYPGVSLNSALKQNLYAIFVCIMKCLPILIVGSPGCSKSLATRIISDNFKEQHQKSKRKDPWIQSFTKITQFFLQGSESCLTSSVQNRFKQIKQMHQANLAKIKKPSDKRIPVFIFDEMGLAEKSQDNPLKAIHQPLQLSSNDHKNRSKGQREIAFLGISNNQLDLSKMSRFLILRRPDIQLQDLKKTAKQISKNIFLNTDFNHSNIQHYLEMFCQTYNQFLAEWRQQQGRKSEALKNFFGLRDFYNLIRTFADIIKQQENRNKLDKIDEVCDLSIFRNINGLPKSYQNFRHKFFKKLKKQCPRISYDVLNQINANLSRKSRRYQMVIYSNIISQSIFSQIVSNKFSNCAFFIGSPFKQDSQNSEYITKSLSSITRIVKSDKKMVARHINKAVQGALFDLFNKFFVKRQNGQHYRVSMDSGYTAIQSVHTNFNTAVLISIDDLARQSPAFLNRFQKYQFDFSVYDNKKIEKIYLHLRQALQKILQICKNEGLSHYKLQHLFLNYSENSLKSLIMKHLLAQNDRKETEDTQYSIIVRNCIYNLSRVATKDFQYILKLIILKSEDKNLQCFTHFKDGLQNKSRVRSENKISILIVTDQNNWRADKSKDVIIYLQQINNQNYLIEKIEEYMMSPLYKQSTLFLDFSRQSLSDEGKNLNDNIAFLKSQQLRIQISYIIYLIEKCISNVKLKSQKQHSFNTQIKIVLNYNRLYHERFSQLSFTLPYQIFSVDGSSKISNKQKIFQSTNMKEIIDKCLKKIKIKIKQVQQTENIKKILQSFCNEISKNEGIFSQSCKDALLLLQSDNININDEDIIQLLKDPGIVKKYNSITTALTKKFFDMKVISPIVMLIKTLSADNILLNYGDNSKMLLLKQSIEVTDQKPNPQRNVQNLSKFLILMAKKKIQLSKSLYKQYKRDNLLQIQGDNLQFETSMPTFFPYSQLETKILFSPQVQKRILQLPDQSQDSVTQFNKFEQEYNKKLQNAFKTNQLLNLYKSLTRSSNNYWKSMFIADVVGILLQKAKISLKYTFHIVSQIEIQFKMYDNKFLKKIVLILKNFDIWSSAFRIFHIFCQNSFTKKMDKTKSLKAEQIAKQLIKYISQIIPLNKAGLNGIKGGKQLDQKLKSYSQIHHSVYFEIQNIVNLKLIEQKNLLYKQMTIVEQFITIWQAIYEKAPTISIKDQIEEMQKISKTLTRQKRLLAKIQIIEKFFHKVLDLRLDIQPEIYQYLANKLYLKWFEQCEYQQQINNVFSKFYNLCEKNNNFAHNSTDSLQIALSSMQLDYKYGSFLRSLQKLSADFSKDEYNVNLKKKLLLMISKKCQQKKYADNLSILLTNMFYNKLTRSNTIVEDQQKGFTMNDLQKNFQLFNFCFNKVYQGAHSIIKIISFAFMKLYLYHYVEIAKPENEICQKIDNIISVENNQIANDLRFYCLKLLRTKYNSKQISEQFVKISTFKWCGLFKQEMKEQPSRAIQVPKVPEKLITKQLQSKIQKFKEFQGRDVQYLNDIINLGSQSVGGRYVIFNFFSKYIYTMAYNKQYQQKIIDHVKKNQNEYTAKIGKQEYKLILRYTISKFDHNYNVQNHQTFEQSQLVVLNNINWMYASKEITSPVHSLFFLNKNIRQSIQGEISQSFLPCGPENPFITTAKLIYNQTRNCNIGVYLCSKNCDYIYSILNCGWPVEGKQCIMCGQNIGGQGSHKLARVQQGARRLISQKFIDKSIFYVGSLKSLQQFWQAQRWYIQAQINRMRTKSEITYKPVINKARKQQKQVLLGYNLSITTDRIGVTTSKIIILCIQSNLYALVSLDLVKPEQCLKLFGSNNKQVVLNKLNQNIKSLTKQIKEALNLNTKFYSWMFGIQAQIYTLLINFSKEYQDYVKKLQNKTEAFAKKLQDKMPSLSQNQYKLLFQDIKRVMKNGLIFKQFQQIQDKNEMNGRNQFTRQVFQQRVQEIVAKNFLQGKLPFITIWEQVQGKMQFPFDIMLTQSKQDSKLYPYSRILKITSETLTLQQISNKYEFVIRNKHPVLDYLLKNSLTFNNLSSFKQVIKPCNLFGQNINMKVTRSYCKSYKLKQFNRQMCNQTINIEKFIANWKKIAKQLGPIQIQCKIFGTMNPDVNAQTQLYQFLLDNNIKRNGNGKTVVGLYHNFAILHNQTLNILKNRKNQIPKYKKLNLFVEDYKKNPQMLQDQDCIIIKQKQIVDKILQSSVPSIKYGENLVYMNFDSCQTYFLNKLKGKSQIQPDINKYKSVVYIGQSFSRSIPDTRVTAIGDVRECFYKEISQSEKKEIKQMFEIKNEVEKYQIKGQLEQLINRMSQNIDYLSKNQSQKIHKYITNYCQNLRLDNLKVEQVISNRQICEIIPLFQLIQELLIPILVVNNAIPQQFKQKMTQQEIVSFKQFLQSLPKQQTSENPTAAELCVAIRRFIYRNLMNEYLQQGRAFDDIIYKDDLWPYGYDVSKNFQLSAVPILSQFPASKMVQLLNLVQNFVK